VVEPTEVAHAITIFIFFAYTSLWKYKLGYIWLFDPFTMKKMTQNLIEKPLRYDSLI